MLGQAPSTRTGLTVSPPFVCLRFRASHTSTPAYASFRSSLWSEVLPHFLPVRVVIPSQFSPLAISTSPFPARHSLNTLSTTIAVAGSGSSLLRSVAPSRTLTLPSSEKLE